MVGLLKPDKGHIFVADQEITRMTEEELFPIQKDSVIYFRRGPF